MNHLSYIDLSICAIASPPAFVPVDWFNLFCIHRSPFRVFASARPVSLGGFHLYGNLTLITYASLPLHPLHSSPFSHPNRRLLSCCSFSVVVIFPHLHLLRVALNIHPVGTASTQTSSFCSSRAALRMVTVEVEEDKYRKVNFNHVANFEGHLKERMFCIHMIKIQTD